jgi:excisionase family DNA binding protein
MGGKKTLCKSGPYGLTVEEAGRLVGLSRSAAYRAVKEGSIPALKIGRAFIVPRAIWLRKLGVEAAPKSTREVDRKALEPV